MTAQRSVIPPGHAAEQPRRRVAWARRENDRRRRAYDAELETWCRREEQLERLRIEATGFIGSTQPRTGLPVELDADEVVYRILPTAKLVEAQARHMAGLPAPSLAIGAAPVDASGPALPRGLRVLDAGMAVVTDRRIAFRGRTAQREWAFRDLVGPGHHPHVPVTLLYAVAGHRPAGLEVPSTAALNFRFYLTLAFAAAVGKRAAIAPQIDVLLAAHRAARPLPPPPVAPQDAPATLLGPERVAVAAAAVVAVAFAGLSTGPGRASTDLPHRAAPDAARIADWRDGWTPGATGDGRDREGGPSPSPSVRPAGPGSPPAPSPAAVSVALTTSARPEPSPSARQIAVARSRPAPPVVVATTTPPGGAPAPAPTTPAATTPPPPPSPAPSTAAPSAGPPVVEVQICLDLLRLPLVDQLLCGRADG